MFSIQAQDDKLSVPPSAALVAMMAIVQAFRDMQEYDWDNDKTYQAVLPAVLGTTEDPDQRLRLTHRAQVLYWNKITNLNIDFNEYEKFVADPITYESAISNSSSASSTPVPTTPTTPVLPSAIPFPAAEPAIAAPAANVEMADSDGDAPYPRNFAQTVQLIQSGGEVPGIRLIEPTVLKDEGTPPSSVHRRKPWEESALKETNELDNEDGGANLEGTFGDVRDKTIVQEYPEDNAGVSA
ncbi:hypothetical protein BJ878DRAFT_511182 [Calycina marina]|uniref:Uncharacterized protein n=1 Tax=Calycina marina TaxID=1763456 RepID=A0A9P7Z1H7_9HELO|nr:hypothetical protein BJ878DRAFT_511182 [Calycina marina]